jgi:antitoxin component of RelBE/YafQ-DinJ toxin-antitoxin module
MDTTHANTLLQLRIERSLKAAAKELAERNQRTLSQEVRWLLLREVGQSDPTRSES